MPDEHKFYFESDTIYGSDFYFESDDGKLKCRITSDLLFDLLRKAYKKDAYDGSSDHHLFKYGSKHTLEEAKKILAILKKALPVLSKNPGVAKLCVNYNVPDNELKKLVIKRTIYNSIYRKSKPLAEVRSEARKLTPKARVIIKSKGEEGEGNYEVEIPTYLDLINLIAFLKACVASRQGFTVDKPSIDYAAIKKNMKVNKITLHYVVE